VWKTIGKATGRPGMQILREELALSEGLGK
jgi:hypothetical protein